MGRYVPPDAEGVLTANQASGKGHALGRRAAKLKTEGALTVRFEMPFAVWCDTCENNTNTAAAGGAEPKKGRPQLIGQGVRFNAEKRRVGSYFSTPIYSFRMRHAACGGALEIRTDPQHTSYEVVAGGRRRDTGEDRAADDSLVGTGAALLQQLQGRDPEEQQQQQQQREAAFSSLEKTIADRAALAAAGARLEALGDVAARQWDDPYARNQALRRAFRVGRHARERDAGVAEEIRSRLGLGIELLPESDEDARRARLVEFGTRPSRGDGAMGVGVDGEETTVLAKPLFGGGGGGGRTREEVSVVEEKTRSSRGKGKKGRKLKSEVAASRMRDSLVSEIVGNTRLATDPFLEPRSSKESKSTTLLPGLKRKRDPDEEIGPPTEGRPVEKATAISSALVDYDSD